MSADDGFYIGEFPDGFRVIHAQAIENVHYFKEGTKEWKKEVRAYFGGAPVFKTYEEALLSGGKMLKEYGWTEYGLCSVGFFNIDLTKK